MAYFEFPHTRNYDGDLGWVIKKIIELTERYNDFFEYNKITFADPLQWDITKQYPPYQIAFDYDQGYSYISKRPVPAGVTITNPDYWCLVGPLIVDAYARSEIQTILEFVSNIYETSNIATAVRQPGEYVVANGQLYKVTAAINIGEGYTEGINVTKWTIENMIEDRFPIGEADIDNNAVTNYKIAADAVTQSKIRDHSITKLKMVNDKYLFIGDSWNADYHYSWGKQLATIKGLTLGTDYWNVAVPGGGFANGLVFPAIHTEAASMTAQQKMDITKILIVLGINDWSGAEADVTNGVRNIEAYLNTTFPNATVIFVAAQWGYFNATARYGIINAYNYISAACKTSRFIDKAYTQFMDPHYLDSDMVHPTQTGNYELAVMLNNILEGGTPTERTYPLHVTKIDTTGYGGAQIPELRSLITAEGTHIWRNAFTGISWSTPKTINHNGVIIGRIDAADNYIFQRACTIPLIAFVQYFDANNAAKYGLFKCRLYIAKHSDNDDYWDVALISDCFVDPNNPTYNAKLGTFYFQFNVMVDPWEL